MAIPFNALKNGSLSYINISNCKIDFNDFSNLIKSMCISEEDHNEWYGFQFNSYIHKDTPEYFNQVFHCNLEKFIFNGNDLRCDINYIDPKNIGVENIIKDFITKSKKLDTLVLSNCKINKNFIEGFAEGLKSKNNLKYLSFSNSGIDSEIFKSFYTCFYLYMPKQNKNQNKEIIINGNKIEDIYNPNFNIEIFDLSNNKLGYSGIEYLCNALKINKSIKKLNIFNNLIGVGGARRLAKVFEINNNLIELDIGFNRIKNAGIKSIIKSIQGNKKSNLKYLGVKYNFIDNKTFEEILDIIENNKNIKIEEINIKDNKISPQFLMKFWNERFTKINKKLKIDIFEILANIIPEKLERTVWVSTASNPKKNDIMKEIKNREIDCCLEDKSYLGIPLSIRKLRKTFDENKKGNKNEFKNIYIEFIMPNSVNRMLKLGATSKFTLNGKNCKIYKAGTKPDILIVKKKDYSNLPQPQPKIQFLKNIIKNINVSNNKNIINVIKNDVKNEIKTNIIEEKKNSNILNEIKLNKDLKIEDKKNSNISNEIKLNKDLKKEDKFKDKKDEFLFNSKDELIFIKQEKNQILKLIFVVIICIIGGIFLYLNYIKK